MAIENNINSMAILLVDDEDKTIKYFQRAFALEFRILTASSVDQGIELLSEHHNDIGVLITDQRMPVKSGVELLQHTREYYPDIVRILTTAYSNLDSAIAAINSGEIFRYITKPWDIRTLRGELISALNYYAVQYERNLLLKEKLSVWQQLTAINKVRDMIIMAGSFSHMRYSLNAIHALLTQYPHATVEPSDMNNYQHFNPWHVMQTEIRQGIDCAQKIILNTLQETDKNIVNIPIDINQLLDHVLTNLPTLTRLIKWDKSRTHAPHIINGNLHQIEYLLKIIIQHSFDVMQKNHYLQAITADANALEITLEKHSPQGIKLTLVMTAQKPIHHPLTSSLISAFFIAYHHGGCIKITYVNEMRLTTIELPTDPVSTKLVELPDDYLEEIFDAYENKNGLH